MSVFGDTEPTDVTYCLGLLMEAGLVLAADSRTNAGVDYVSSYRKVFDFSMPGERVVFILTSGNLSITQSVINLLRQDLHKEGESLHTMPTMFSVCRYIGHKVRQVEQQDRPVLEKDRIDFHVSLIVAGQIKGEEPALYLVYTQGNFIQATEETPFVQIGETKYGKPILDRAFNYRSSLKIAALCSLLSMDSTMISNLSVGSPVDLLVYERDTFRIAQSCRLQENDPFWVEMRRAWQQSLQNAFHNLPDIPFAFTPDPSRL
ncbi:proteasome-type protease [Gloeobacter morelensis]|uniref:proteasome-type protease n=1 Tax=Gloeobacter morelensis TaxID=2907343 RepID=UPI001E3BC7CB|nr:proteasome-type protease [Gloeobacter morelensis]